MTHSIILIGMPGSGKSTLGILLAKELGLDFIDTDVAIQVRENRTLQQILDQQGYRVLREIEESVLLEADLAEKVVATGGSVVYGERAMQRLQEIGVIIYLTAGIDTLEQRIHNYQTRGIAKRPDQSFEDLYQERTALYERYAQISIPCDSGSPEQLVSSIMARLQETDI